MTTGRSRRQAGALGIAAGPLLIAGILLIQLDVPGEDGSGSEYVSYFTENTGQIWTGAILSLLGLAALLVFLAGGLRPVLSSRGSDRGGLPGLVVVAGTAQALFTLVGVTLIAGTAGSSEFFDGFTLDPDTARLVLGMSWLPSIYGGLAASLAVAATSLSARRTGALPRAFARVGFVVAVLLFAGAFVGFGGLLFALWVLAAGVAVVASTRGEGRAVATGAPSAAGSAV